MQVPVLGRNKVKERKKMKKTISRLRIMFKRTVQRVGRTDKHGNELPLKQPVSNGVIHRILLNAGLMASEGAYQRSFKERRKRMKHMVIICLMTSSLLSFGAEQEFGKEQAKECFWISARR